MWFQRAEADLKCLAHKGGNVRIVRVIVEKDLEHMACGPATRLTNEFIEPTSAADVITSVVRLMEPNLL